MKTIDFIYRYDPTNPDQKAPPKDAAEARTRLEEGNRVFAQWIDRCRSDADGTGSGAQFVVDYDIEELGLAAAQGKAVKQAPFAVLLGCSDARVPAELLFGQSRNNLFVIRLAGNILTAEGMGSIDYAVAHLGESIRVVVVLGHTGCGAVSAAVDTYLDPWAFLSMATSHGLRSIVNSLLVPVRKSASALKSVFGADVSRMEGYRSALLETAVFVNAAQTAYNLRQEAEQEGLRHIQVLYSVFDLVSHRVWTLPQRTDESAATDVRLAIAPASLAEFEELAIRMAIRQAHKYAKRHVAPAHPVTPNVSCPCDS